MEQHIKIVGIIHIVFSILGLLAGTIIFFVLISAGMISDDGNALAILSIIGTAISIFLFVVSAPGLIAGIGLLYKKNWARILTIIISILDLLNIPFGTMLGAYSIWVLFNDETVKLFKGNEQHHQFA